MITRQYCIIATCCVACSGSIEDNTTTRSAVRDEGAVTVSADPNVTSDTTPVVDAGAVAPQTTALSQLSAAGSGAVRDSYEQEPAAAPAPPDPLVAQPAIKVPTANPAAVSGVAPEVVASVSSPPTLGIVGDIDHPAVGPRPREADKIEGEGFVLVKNWDFGTKGTVRNIDELSAEFQYHDQWNTIANGTNYGAVTVAPDSSQSIRATGLQLPNDMQPVQSPDRPYREFTDTALRTYVRPLSPTQASVSAAAHDAGNGSITSHWKLPTGGAILERDVLWETRVRMPTVVPGYWYALWTAGSRWQKGAEVDVLESFGGPYIDAMSFHSDSIGGSNEVDYKSWPKGLTSAGVPSDEDSRDLTDWHVWTWLYLRDDSYQIFYDGNPVQSGMIHWTYGGAKDGEPIDMYFMFDFGWGHVGLKEVNITLPAKSFPVTYEIDYSRVYMR